MSNITPKDMLVASMPGNPFWIIHFGFSVFENGLMSRKKFITTNMTNALLLIVRLL
jgi:hypothetical protein